MIVQFLIFAYVLLTFITDRSKAVVFLLFSVLLTFINDRSKAAVLLWFSVACFWCHSFGDISPYVYQYY